MWSPETRGGNGRGVLERSAGHILPCRGDPRGRPRPGAGTRVVFYGEARDEKNGGFWKCRSVKHGVCRAVMYVFRGGNPRGTSGDHAGRPYGRSPVPAMKKNEWSLKHGVCRAVMYVFRGGDPRGTSCDHAGRLYGRSPVPVMNKPNVRQNTAVRRRYVF